MTPFPYFSYYGTRALGLARILAGAAAATLMLDMLGISPTQIVTAGTVLSAVSASLILPLQLVFQPLVAGRMVELEGKVRIGDTITVALPTGIVTGTITAIDLHHVSIVDVDGAEWFAPSLNLITGEFARHPKE